MLTTTRFLILTVLVIVIGTGVYCINIFRDAAKAYVFSYPAVLMELTEKAMLRDNMDNANRFTHARTFPDHNFRNVVRPNNDTLYSIAWLDLDKQPVVLTVPDTHERYYVMPLMDAWTNVFATIGKRTTGTQAGSYLITGPNWRGQAPEGMPVYPSPTPMVWVIGRIQTNGKADVKNAIALQDQFNIVPLDKWQRGDRTNTSVDFVRTSASDKTDPAAEIDAMSGVAFFDKLSDILTRQPMVPNDPKMRSQLKTLGVNDNTNSLAPQPNFLKRFAINLGKDLAHKKIKQYEHKRDNLENGWAVNRNGIGNYGDNYGIRAVVALIGLGALPPAEASYPNTVVDSQLRELNGKHSYQLHFAPQQIPPVDAFWSLTMYDNDGFLVDNPIARYTIGDRDPLNYNVDGSLDITISHQRPSDSEANWLPAPTGNFALTMRLYQPKTSFLNGSWVLPGIERLD